MKGLVTINKVYKDGRRELVMDGECNSLTDGLSRCVAGVLSDDPSKILSNYKFSYFQLGTSSHYTTANWDEGLPHTTSKNFYNLHSPFTSEEDYGIETNVRVVELDIITAKENFKTISDVDFTTTSAVLGVLTPESTANINETTLLVKITLDENAAAGKTIREAGLFVRNIENNFMEDRPILAAYKSMTEPIEKTDEFSLEIEWIISLSVISPRGENRGRFLTFRPSIQTVLPSYEPTNTQGVVGYQDTTNYVQYLSSGETYDIEIECLTPTVEDGYLTWSIHDFEDYKTDTAVSGTHYVFTDGKEDLSEISFPSSMFWPAGTQKMSVELSCLDTGSFYQQKVLCLQLDSFTGKEVIASPGKHHRPDKFIFLLRSNRDPSEISLSSMTTTAGSYQISKVGLDSSSSDNVTVYLDVSAAGGSYTFSTVDRVVTNATSKNNNIVMIPSGSLSSTYALSAPAGAVIVSSYNTVSGSIHKGGKIYQQRTHSDDFRSYKPANDYFSTFSYEDVSANANALQNEKRPEWYMNNIIGPSIWYSQWPTALGFSHFDSFPNQPAAEAGQSSFFYSLTPDGLEKAQFNYINKYYYVYPTSSKLFVNHGSKLRSQFVTFEIDNLGRKVNGAPEVGRFSSAMSSFTYSVYVKKESDNIKDPWPDMVDDVSATSSKYFQLYAQTRGYPGVGAWFAQTGKAATFKWDDSGGLEVFKTKATGLFKLEDEDLFGVQYEFDSDTTDFDPSDIGKTLSSTNDSNRGTIVSINPFDPSARVHDDINGAYYTNGTNAGTIIVSGAAAIGDGDNDDMLSAVGGIGFVSAIAQSKISNVANGLDWSVHDAGVFSGTNVDPAGQADIDKYGITDRWAKDGWYRAWVSVSVDPELYETSYWAKASTDGRGAVMVTFLYPGIGETYQEEAGIPGISHGNRGNYYEVPTVCSGTLVAWHQTEVVLKSIGSDDAAPALASNGFLPRPYQPRPFSWFSPKGSGYLTGTGNTTTTFTF